MSWLRRVVLLLSMVATVVGVGLAIMAKVGAFSSWWVSAVIIVLGLAAGFAVSAVDSSGGDIVDKSEPSDG